MNEVQALLQGLMAEYDAIVQQREIVRQQEESAKKQGAELDRKLEGLKQSIHGLSLYSTAKNEPPVLTKEHQTISSLMATIPDITKPYTVAKTLSECCRDILMRSGEWMSALQVRQGLHAAGFNFSEYKSNPLSSIHTTLKRIAESGQAWSHPDGNETVYRWKKKGEAAPPLSEIMAKKAAETAITERKKEKRDEADRLARIAAQSSPRSR